MTTYSTPTSNLSVCFVFYFPLFWSNAVNVGNNIYSWRHLETNCMGLKTIRMEKGAVYSSRLWTNYMTLLQSWLFLQYGVAHNIWQQILPNRKLIQFIMIFDPLVNAEPCIVLKTVILINGTAIRSSPLSLHLLMDTYRDVFKAGNQE